MKAASILVVLTTVVVHIAYCGVYILNFTIIPRIQFVDLLEAPIIQKDVEEERLLISKLIASNAKEVLIYIIGKKKVRYMDNWISEIITFKLPLINFSIEM